MWKRIVLHARTCKRISYHARTCKRIVLHARTCKRISYHARTCKRISYHARTCKRISPHARTCKRISPHARTCKRISYHARTCKRIVLHACTCKRISCSFKVEEYRSIVYRKTQQLSIRVYLAKTAAWKLLLNNLFFRCHFILSTSMLSTVILSTPQIVDIQDCVSHIVDTTNRRHQSCWQSFFRHDKFSTLTFSNLKYVGYLVNLRPVAWPII
jgi:hypothetical protein